MSDSERPTLAELAAMLKREPLVGTTAASDLLNIKPPNFKRDAAPHLTAVPIEGSAAVYFRSEVRKLAARRAKAKTRPAAD